MPSLQTFYLTDNRLAQVNMETQAYLPNLRLLNLDRNRLTGYAPVWHLLRYSTKLSIVKYDDNEELSLLPDKVRELY
jgi:Leucine-rich repeat (LRR) protein